MIQDINWKWLSLILLNCSLVGFLCVSKQPIMPAENDFSQIENRLKSIENQLAKPAEKPDFSPVNKNLKQLSELIQQLQNKDDHQLGELFSTSQISIQNQLKNIAGLLSKLDEQKHPGKSLPASSLPFKVLSIDCIQEVSVASVAFNYKTTALEKGDSLAGWKVAAIDFAAQSIEFENNESAHVFLKLTQMEPSNA